MTWWEGKGEVSRFFQKGNDWYEQGEWCRCYSTIEIASCSRSSLSRKSRHANGFVMSVEMSA